MNPAMTMTGRMRPATQQRIGTRMLIPASLNGRRMARPPMRANDVQRIRAAEPGIRAMAESSPERRMIARNR
jgi:hypothetical protein